MVSTNDNSITTTNQMRAVRMRAATSGGQLLL
jgi:hypothetical protein